MKSLPISLKMRPTHSFFLKARAAYAALVDKISGKGTWAMFVSPMITIAHLVLPMCWYYVIQIWNDLVEKEEDNDV